MENIIYTKKEWPKMEFGGMYDIIINMKNYYDNDITEIIDKDIRSIVNDYLIHELFFTITTYKKNDYYDITIGLLTTFKFKYFFESKKLELTIGLETNEYDSPWCASQKKFNYYYYTINNYTKQKLINEITNTKNI